jgi:cytidyltransferase-like protein
MVVSCSDLPTLRQRHRDKTIVLASGVFDLLHTGHLAYLQSLHQYGDITVVMVKSDARVRRHKAAGRPIIPEQDRVRLVGAIKGIDYAFVGPHLEPSPEHIDPTDGTYRAVFGALQPDIFICANPAWKKLEAIGGVTVVIGPRFVEGAFPSTTAVIEHIRQHNT